MQRPERLIGSRQARTKKNAYHCQRQIHTYGRVMAGVSESRQDEPLTIPLLRMDPEGYKRQVSRLNQPKRERDNDEVQR